MEWRIWLIWNILVSIGQDLSWMERSANRLSCTAAMRWPATKKSRINRPNRFYPAVRAFSKIVYIFQFKHLSELTWTQILLQVCLEQAELLLYKLWFCNCRNWSNWKILFCLNKSTTLSPSGETEEFVNSDDIVSRTLFPESWLWEEVVLPNCPSTNRQWWVWLAVFNSQCSASFDPV